MPTLANPSQDKLEAAWRHNLWWYKDRIKQDMLNNIWSNNPGELDRWMDDR